MKINKSILGALCIAVASTACSKVDDSHQDVQPTTPTDTTYKLNVDIPRYNIHYDRVQLVKTLGLLHNDKQIGYYLNFERDSLKFNVFILYSGQIVSEPNGSINGHPFGVFNDSMNVCHGPQRVPLTYSVFK